MIRRTAAILLCLALPLAACKPKASNARGSNMSVKDVADDLNTVLRKLNLTTIPCPDYAKPRTAKANPEIVDGCFTSDSNPESLLDDLSEELQARGEVQIGWRMDVGRWLSSYLWKGEKYVVFVTLTAPGQNRTIAADPTMKTVGSLGTYTIGPKE